MVRCKVVVLTIALSAFAAPAAFGQAAIQEPGAFEFYHPNEDVLNGGVPTPEAALVSTPRRRNAYAAIDNGSLRADFNKSSARYKIGMAPAVPGVFTTMSMTTSIALIPIGASVPRLRRAGSGNVR
jgi:hypothetical protein